jgi:hypothetical protein
MNVPWGKILGVASRVALAAVMGIPTTEEKAKRIGQAAGALKKDAVLDLIQTELQLGQLVIGRDLSQDGEVMKAAGAIVDSVVSLHNVIAAKSGAKPA